MAEYYVIRDKNTGLYFRGKGVNRWGKHYNQASVYRIKANAENTVKEVSWRGEQAEVVPIQIIETDADVVPKSEVEYWKEQCFHACMHNGLLDFTKIKAEIAREIIGEIENARQVFVIPCIKANGTIDNKRVGGVHLYEEDYNFIKKKYTE